MQRAFDSAAALKLLSEGLLKANPSNPDVPMWTVEDFDEEPKGERYSRRIWEKHPACQKAGMPWRRVYRNPLESFRGLTQEEIRAKLKPNALEEKVEVIDPKDFPTN